MIIRWNKKISKIKFLDSIFLVLIIYLYIFLINYNNYKIVPADIKDVYLIRIF